VAPGHGPHALHERLVGVHRLTLEARVVLAEVAGPERARRHGLFGLVSEQSLYTLAHREVELEVLPACLDYGIGVLPWSPLQGGLLGGILEREQKEGRRASERVQTLLAKFRPRVEQYEAYCKELGKQPSQVALAWLLHQPAVTAPIVGPRTMAQLESALAALKIRLGKAELGRLDEIWPGHQPAPEDYAW
jgi:aryl-alcohol dehydrogenase-like predicted oxidoreductase